jgi:Tetrahydrofolate dehydrogenase/cyclohydrolase, NAD(P)-binding domain
METEIHPSWWISYGAIVVDTSYHFGGVGDIDPEGLQDRCAVAPVPGGIGPMTILARFGIRVCGNSILLLSGRLPVKSIEFDTASLQQSPPGL